MEQEPGWSAQPSGEVGKSGIRGDHEITGFDHRGGSNKIPGGIDLLLARHESFAKATGVELLCAKTLLKRDQAEIRTIAQWCKEFQRY